MCYEIWKSQTFVILSFDYPVSQDFVEICTPFVCFVSEITFCENYFALVFFLVLGKKSYSLIITKIHFVFLRGRQNIMLLCERNYWTDWQVHRSVFTAWNSIWFSLRLFSFVFDIFSILMYILIFKFWSIICYRLQMFIYKVSKLFSSIN